MHSTNYQTRNWIIGILIGGYVASFIIGMLHGVGILSEPESVLWHTTRDWLLVMVIILPITYVLARFLPGDSKKENPNLPKQ